jgi:hypothetical protein
VDTVDPATGELVRSYSTDGEPDRVLLHACGSRRSTVCAPCAGVYHVDSWHLVVAGLRGGKGVPDTVVEHPRVFVTLTAPSFGPVHTRADRAGGAHPCRPAARSWRCRHGRPVGCWAKHDNDDPLLRAPICPDCYQTEAAVLWNASVGELWRRTTISIGRQLAHHARVPVRQLPELVRVSFTRVAEYQDRGAVHVHAIIRLDAATDDGQVLPPPEPFSPDLLIAAIHTAVSTVTAPLPSAEPDGQEQLARWGPRLDVRTIYARLGLGRWQAPPTHRRWQNAKRGSSEARRAAARPS